MQRPPSIVRFERLYLASFAFGLIGWAVSWQPTATRLAADPRTAMFGWILPVAVLLSVAVTLGLWYLAARRASLIAKWIIVVLTALSALRFLINLSVLLRGTVPVGALLVSLVTLLLGVAAVVPLFRADARTWFGEDRTDEMEDE